MAGELPASHDAPRFVERWDVGFLPTARRRDPNASYKASGSSGGGNQNKKGAAMKHGQSKFHALVLHPVAVKPPGYDKVGGWVLGAFSPWVGELQKPLLLVLPRVPKLTRFTSPLL